MRRFKFFRRMCGGIWYKHEMTGQLPNCYGSWWSRKSSHHPRYEAIIETENYNQ